MAKSGHFGSDVRPRSPDPMGAQFQQAVGLHKMGRLAEAEQLYAAILNVNPLHFDALHMAGIVALQTGKLDAGINLLIKATAINPSIAEVHNNLGNAFIMLRRFDEALISCDKAIRLNAKLAEAWNNRAIALQELFRFDDALTSSDKAIALKRDYALAYNIRAISLKELGRYEDAIANYDKAIALNPNIAVFHYNRANLMLAINRADDALASFDAAIRLKGDFAEAFAGRGAALSNLGRTDAAIESCRKAIALNPELADAHNNIGNVYSSLNLLTEARDSYTDALTINPRHQSAQVNLSNVLRRLGLIDEAIAAHERALALDPNNAEAHRSLLLTLSYHPSLDLDEYFAEHRRFEDKFARRHYLAVRPHRNRSEPERKLKIGYLSSDFREHTVARSVLPIVRNHSRDAFDIYFYADVARPDAVTEEFKAHAAGWRSIVGQSDEMVATMIRNDRIDILVCLASRFDRNRPLVCAFNPAPIQISFHDIATSGLAVMDYMISDRVMTPRRGEESFTERVLCLPSFYLAEPPADLPAIAKRTGPSVVFGSFNNPAKISNEVLDLWGRMMAEIPESLLVLRYFSAYEALTLRERIAAALGRHGIDANRVRYPASESSHSESLEQYNEIDIALDTFPFSGSTTTFDALVMGVPVVTMPGKTMVSRWSAAMLTSIGLVELIARNTDDYVAIAKNMAHAEKRRALIRGSLRETVLSSPLTDHKRKTRYLERYYRAVWRRWCAAQTGRR